MEISKTWRGITKLSRNLCKQLRINTKHMNNKTYQQTLDKRRNWIRLLKKRIKNIRKMR